MTTRSPSDVKVGTGSQYVPWRRFWEKVEKGADCWLWTGKRNEHGYGRLRVFGKHWYAHRFAYELTTGPIPDGMEVCHSCDKPQCVRPDHLFLGTQADNMADMHAKGRRQYHRKTHCRNGHAFTPENTRYHITGYQRCRECENARRRKDQRDAA